MSEEPPSRIANPRLGLYFGIFAAAAAGFAVLALVFEEMGVDEGLLRFAILLVPMGLYGVVAYGARATRASDFFFAGRRVPAVFHGLVSAAAALGGAGTVALTGLFLIDGFDAWAFPVGLAAGATTMGVLTAPYLRKFGGATLPGFLGRRFESRLLRLVAAAVMAVPILLVLVAEMKFASGIAGRMTGLSPELTCLMVALALGVMVLPGGMRSVTWSGSAAALVLFMALITLMAAVGLVMTNMPIAQLSYGPVLRTISLYEKGLAVPPELPSTLSMSFAGAGFERLVQHMADPAAALGSLSYVLLEVGVVIGVAAAPWLLPRSTATLGVYEARKGQGWATFYIAVVATTVSAAAVFLRADLVQALAPSPTGAVGSVLTALKGSGELLFARPVPTLLADLSVRRDDVLFWLPLVSGFPGSATLLLAAGVLAAALVAAAHAMMSVAMIASEDGLFAFAPEPESDFVRIWAARGAGVGATILCAWMALELTIDPLGLVLAALALSGGAVFPVVVLAIWWKRMTSTAALVGLCAGFGSVAISLVAGDLPLTGVPATAAGPIVAVVVMLVMVVVAVATPMPSRSAIEVVREIRVPGGETVYDHEERLTGRRIRRVPAAVD